MNPTQALDIATEAAKQASAPGGLIWLLFLIIILLLGVVILVGRYLFTQTGNFNEFLQTAYKDHTSATTKLEQTMSENTRVIEQCTDVLKRLDRRS